MAQYTSVSQDDAECPEGKLKFRNPPGSFPSRFKTVLMVGLMVIPWALLLISYTSPLNSQGESYCAASRIKKLSMKRNVYYDASTISNATRFAALKQKGATLWFTGLSGSGKSTVGRALERYLIENRHQVYRLDGDNVRIGLNRDLGFTPEDRQESVRRVGEVSALFNQAGVITLVGLVSPYRKDRNEVRELHKRMGIPFVEVFVDVPIEVVMKRDPKGLYKRAVKGEIKHFTGISAPYEAPLNPEIHLLSANMTIEEEVKKVVSYLESSGLLTGVESIPNGYPGIALPVGGEPSMQNLEINSSPLINIQDQTISTNKESNKQKNIQYSKNQLEKMPKILLREEDLHWVQVISEGWASPLRGFMRESTYLQSLHFQSILFDEANITHGSLNISKATNFSDYTSPVSLGKRINMAVPIVLPIQDIMKKVIKESKSSSVILVSPSGEHIAVLKDIEIYLHRKYERIARTFGTMDKKHPVIKSILNSGKYLIGGEIDMLVKRIQYNDGLDKFRKTPYELRQEFDKLKADVVFAFQTRNPTHAGHAYLMKTARKQLLAQGYKNPVLWLSPLGGWTKEDDVPLDVRVRQHEAILKEGMLNASSTVLSIWPSPMIYAGPREVQWHAISRKNAGASYFVVGRDPAGIKHSAGFKLKDDGKDVYAGEHGRYILHMSPGFDGMKLLSFTKVYYDIQDFEMKPLDKKRKKDFLSISGSRMRKMAREGLVACKNNKIPTGWENNPTCVPPKFMSQAGWKIVVNYYQNINDTKWIPFATPFVPPYSKKKSMNVGYKEGKNIKEIQWKSTGKYGTMQYKFGLESVDGNYLSPWHDIPLHNKKYSNESLDVYNVVIEIPKGIMAKMEVNKEKTHNPIMQDGTHHQRIPRFYRYGVPFFNYGMFPQTWEDPAIKNERNEGGDNDPLDMIELGSKRLSMGSIVPVKIIGIYELIDQNEIDSKVLVLNIHDQYASEIDTLIDYEKYYPGKLERLKDWLINYKIAEGKEQNIIQKKAPTSVEYAKKVIQNNYVQWQHLLSNATNRETGFWLPTN